GIKFVTHQTKFLPYLSMTSSRLGKPNAYISREKNPNNTDNGELARRGSGFYTMAGIDREWHPDYGEYKINYRLNPHARVGTDFFLYNNEVILLNAAALEIASEIEAQKISPREYFVSML